MKTQKTRSVFSRVERSNSLLKGAIDNTFVQLGGFGALIIAVVLLVSVDLDGRERAWHQLEPGQAAAQDVVSTRSFVFAQRDEVESAKRREMAANDVPVVFDWEEGQGELVRDRIHQAFSDMREGLVQSARASLAANDPKRLERLLTSSPADPSDALLSTLSSQRRVTLANERRKEVFDKPLGVSIRDSDYESFARTGFDTDAEVVLADIVGELMTNIIVPSQRVLDAEGDRGIFLRRRRGDQVLVEYHVKDIQSRFVTRERIPAMVDETGARRLSAIGDRELRNAVTSTAGALVQPNTFFNQDATLAKREAARQSVADVVIREDFREGQTIVKKGESLTARDVRIIETMLAQAQTLRNTQTFAGTVLICVLLLVTLYVFGRRNIRKFRPERRDIVFMSVTLLVLLIAARFGVWMGLVISEQFDALPPKLGTFCYQWLPAGC